MTANEERFTGTVPVNYDIGLGPILFRQYGQDLAARVNRAGPGSVLETAAGTGIVSRLLRDHLPERADLTVTDLSEAMLATAREKFRARENVAFEPADALDLHFDDGSFDAVACQFGVMFFPDKARGYAEALRVLKPGGHFHFNTWGSWEDNAFARLTHELVAGYFDDNPPEFYRIPFSYHDCAKVLADLTEAGFVDVDIDHVPMTVEIPSASAFARGLVFGNPLAEEIETRGGNPDTIRTALEAMIKSKLGSTVSLKALVVQARKP